MLNISLITVLHTKQYFELIDLLKYFVYFTFHISNYVNLPFYWQNMLSFLILQFCEKTALFLRPRCSSRPWNSISRWIQKIWLLTWAIPSLSQERHCCEQCAGWAFKGVKYGTTSLGDRGRM